MLKDYLDEHSVLKFVPKGLMVPYSNENFLLSHKPGLFFDELEKVSREQKRHRVTRQSIKTTYYRAKKSGYFVIDEGGQPRLTDKGQRKIRVFTPKKLVGAHLLVVFDVAEKKRSRRDEFRRLLVALKFRQVQKSVWQSKYDSRDILHEEVQRLGLSGGIVIYEARDITKK